MQSAAVNGSTKKKIKQKNLRRSNSLRSRQSKRSSSTSSSSSSREDSGETSEDESQDYNFPSKKQPEDGSRGASKSSKNGTADAQLDKENESGTPKKTKNRWVFFIISPRILFVEYLSVFPLIERSIDRLIDWYILAFFTLCWEQLFLVGSDVRPPDLTSSHSDSIPCRAARKLPAHSAEAVPTHTAIVIMRYWIPVTAERRASVRLVKIFYPLLPSWNPKTETKWRLWMHRSRWLCLSFLPSPERS